MGWLLAVVGLVGAVQGVAWLGGAGGEDRTPVARKRATIGAWSAPVGFALLGAGLLLALVPDFMP